MGCQCTTIGSEHGTSKRHGLRQRRAGVPAVGSVLSTSETSWSGAAEVLDSYDDGEWQYGVSFLEFRENFVTHETIYGARDWEAPTWRERS